MRIAIGLMLLTVSATLVITSAVITSAANASTEQIIEETTTVGDLRQTRTLTLSDTIVTPAPPLGVQEPAESRGSLLWVDPISLNGIAANMAITGDGNDVVAGWWLNGARVAVYEATGTGTPSWTRSINTSFFTPVDASDDGSLITGTGRQDQLYAWDVASSTPYCSASHPAGFEGALAITPDVGGTFAGSSIATGVDSRAYGYDSGCGNLFDSTLPGQTQGGRFAANGDWLVVNSRTHAVVFNAQTGAVRGTISIPGETQAAAGISADGNIVAVGGFAHRTYVYQWDGNQYAALWNHNISLATWITAVDVSDDGSTVMVGTVLLSAPERGKVVMYDVASGPTPLWEDPGYGDEVQSVALSADGSIGVAGSWGRFGGTLGPLVAAYRRDNPVPIFTVMDDEIPLVASCFAVDVSNDGTRGCAGGKAVHAREFGNGGYCLAFELQPTAAIELDDRGAPELTSSLVLGQNRPNPLNPTTSIPFTLATNAAVELRIYDGAGRNVRTEQLGRFDAGAHEYVWNGSDARGRRVPSGVYFYEVDADGARATRRLVVTR